MRMKSIITPLAALVLVLGAHAAWSQATLTKAEGRVTNAGKPMPDVQVVLTYQDNGKQYKIKTDKNGGFFFIGLSRGAYTVEVFNATGQSLYQHKNQQIIGEGGVSDKVDIEITGEGGNKGQPRVTAAESEAIKAQNAKATSMNALIGQYNAAIAAKDWDGAITPLQAMIAADPNRWDYVQALGNMQSNKGDYENAVQTYEKAIQMAQGYVSGTTPKDPKDPFTDPAKAKAGIGAMLTAEGNAYLKLKKNPEAIAAYTKAAQMDPNPGVAYFNICATQYNAGNMEGAAAACDKAIQVDPNKAEAYYIKGSAMYGNGKLDADNKYTVPPGTVDALKKYLELAPDGSHANDVKAMLDALGQKIETTYKGTKKK
ncbi:MAG TPA: tetratricopeptide repeat protein [Candidatus Angelobacter sp.]